MQNTDSDSIFMAYLKVFILAIANYLAKISLHEALSNIFLGLSILYLLWKWYRDFKKSKTYDTEETDQK
jgi:hypothetical protein